MMSRFWNVCRTRKRLTRHPQFLAKLKKIHTKRLDYISFVTVKAATLFNYFSLFLINTCFNNIIYPYILHIFTTLI
jgi:hypothetical protein